MPIAASLPRGARELTRGPVASTLIAFALPTLASSALQAISGSINSIWVGHFLGEQALAATVNGNMVSFLLMALVFGTGMSATVLVGRAVGGRDLDQARRVMGTTVGAFAVVAIAVAAFGWLAAPAILGILGTPAGAADLAASYLRMTFVGLPGALLLSLLMMGLRGAGDSLSPLWFTLCGVVIDVALNPVLILGLGPAPALGIGGSALALAVANYLSLVAVVAWIYRRDLAIRLRAHEWRYLRPDARLLWEIVRKGLPMGLQMIVLTLSAMTILSQVNAEGVLTTAAYGIVQQLWGYLQMPTMAVAAGVSAMTAQAIGAGVWPRVREIVRCGLIASVSLTAGMVVLLHLLDKLAIGLFLPGQSPAAPIAEHILLATSWSFGCMAVTAVLFGSLRADGIVIRPLLISIAAMFGVRLAAAYGGYPWIGADALWLSLSAGQVANCIMAMTLYARESRRWTKPTPPAHEPPPEEAVAASVLPAIPG